jgi:hypothetical protein
MKIVGYTTNPIRLLLLELSLYQKSQILLEEPLMFSLLEEEEAAALVRSVLKGEEAEALAGLELCQQYPFQFKVIQL